MHYVHCDFHFYLSLLGFLHQITYRKMFMKLIPSSCSHAKQKHNVLYKKSAGIHKPCIPGLFPIPGVHLKVDQRVQENSSPGIHLNVHQCTSECIPVELFL